MTELKPCPFCGGEAEFFKDVTFKAETGEQVGEIKFFVWCTNCSALVSGDNKQEAFEAWNRRASDGRT
jgi:Lar family restriction alleviation protein